MTIILVTAHLSLMPSQSVKSFIRFAALIAIILLLKSLHRLLLILERRQEFVALLLMTLQAVDSRVRPAAAVTTELLTGLGVFLDHGGLHVAQNW